MIEVVEQHQLATYLQENPTATHAQILEAVERLSKRYYCVWSEDDIDWDEAGVEGDLDTSDIAQEIMSLAERRADYSIGFGHINIRYATLEVLDPNY
jgi:hypothetical protein